MDEETMGAFAESLFSYLQRNAVTADKNFHIPPRQVVEIGLQLRLVAEPPAPRRARSRAWRRRLGRMLHREEVKRDLVEPGLGVR